MIALALVMVLTAAPKENPFRARVEALEKLVMDNLDADTSSFRPLQKELIEASKGHDVETLVLLGRTQAALNEGAAAARALDEAIKLNPSDADAQYYRGLTARQLGDLEETVRYLQKAAELDPKSARRWRSLGVALGQSKKHDEALVAYQKAIDLDPKDSWSRSAAGSLLIKKERGAEGVKLLEKSIALQPDNAYAISDAAEYYQLNGSPRAALPHLEHLLKLKPEDSQTLAKLVQVHQALGNRAERDRRRAQLLSLYRDGKLYPKLPEFCRERFKREDQRVTVFEAFELHGARYRFEVVNASGDPVRSLSLESLDSGWQLDGSWPDNSHKRYGTFTHEPTYEETRKLVVDALADTSPR